MRRHEPLDDDAARARLAGQLDRIERRLTDLETLEGRVDANTRGIADLADWMRRSIANGGNGSAGTGQGSEGADDEPDGDPVPEWLTVTDPAIAVPWLADLHQWVRDVWARYHDIPECWPWHPHVVAELLVNRHLWAAAVAPGNGPDPLAAWHDRWRPGVQGRVTRWLAACERTDGLHVGRGVARWTYDLGALDELAYWWATTHGASPPPGLTVDTTRR